jgi:hypothetical protein
MWARLDDAILDNPKIIAAGPLGFALHVAAITWCARNLTDGFIPKRRVAQLLDLSSLHVREATRPRALHAVTAERVADDLARIGLWHDRGAHWEVHDYLVYNPSKPEVLARRARDRTKKRKQRRGLGVSPPVSPGDSRGNLRYPVPVPVPVPETLSLASLACASTTEFDEFWKAYPRHIDKQKARKAWAKLRPPPLKAILDALTWQRDLADWRKDQGEFVPYPATYLNGRRWEDERPSDPLAAMVARLKAEERAG